MKRTLRNLALGSCIFVLGGLGATSFDMIVAKSGILVMNSSPHLSSCGSITIGAGALTFNNSDNEATFFFTMLDDKFVLASPEGELQVWTND